MNTSRPLAPATGNARCQSEDRQTQLESGPAHLLGSLQFRAQVGDSNRGQGDDIYGSPRAQVDRQVGNGLVIGRLDDGDEIALPEHRVLRDHLAAKVGYLLVHLFEAIGIFVQGLASLGRQGAHQNVCWHDALLASRSQAVECWVTPSRMQPLDKAAPSTPKGQAQNKLAWVNRGHYITPAPPPRREGLEEP